MPKTTKHRVLITDGEHTIVVADHYRTVESAHEAKTRLVRAIPAANRGVTVSTDTLTEMTPVPTETGTAIRITEIGGHPVEVTGVLRTDGYWSLSHPSPGGNMTLTAVSITGWEVY